MHRCLKLLWNTAWSKGYFANEWKKENRVVLAKPGKDCYDECLQNCFNNTMCWNKIRIYYFAKITVITHSENVRY